ncbi:hypothetical protein RmaAA213_15640 [Rhodothermus marinus]|nr:hypothetical protein RmaAA213_15640 [Rhodothermus marinus]
MSKGSPSVLRQGTGDGSMIRADFAESITKAAVCVWLESICWAVRYGSDIVPDEEKIQEDAV